MKETLVSRPADAERVLRSRPRALRVVATLSLLACGLHPTHAQEGSGEVRADAEIGPEIVALTGRDFGPMRRAERRVRETGALLRPGARPLVSDDGIDTERPSGRQPSILAELALPVLILVGFGGWTLVTTGSVKIVEAFLLANTWMLAVLVLRGPLRSIESVAGVIVKGAASVTGALLIVALAYALNALTAELGAAGVLHAVHRPEDLS